MGYSGLTVSLACSLSNGKSTFVRLERGLDLELDQLFSFVDVYLDEFLTDEFDHISPEFLFLESAGVVEGLLKDFDGLFSHLHLVVALSEPEESHQFVLFVLSGRKDTLQEMASSMTF